jgi:hypothetical protein
MNNLQLNGDDKVIEDPTALPFEVQPLFEED